MGASGSKVAQQTVRKFPSRAGGSSPAASAPKPKASSTPRMRPPPTATAPAPDAQPRSRPQASYTKDEAIRADAMDPNRPEFSAEFADRLQKMGIVQPNPTYSPSSIASPFLNATGNTSSASSHHYPSPSSNVTLGVLEARRRLEARAREELENMGKSSDKGREFVDIGTVKQMLVLRQGGASAVDIEKRLGLRPGLVAKLGPQGVVAPAS
ncbi:hypothetical protein F5144DRAFT_70016 [Chaetomium tenue]|uniref:Uncharacterized protein n=1 Tax=Chaetomium tenue TaxID=1854479 RepID=A0ACB7PRJ0_9PEZI|nr:hypothetical protein F5144DRAFT_70016 [Chaetomium globosum]